MKFVNNPISRNEIKGKSILLTFLLFNYFIIFVVNDKNKEIKNIKVCICTLGKEENLYIREFIEHYKYYGVDKIFLYDNNDIDGEHFEKIIGDYIEQDLLQIINWRGKHGIIYKVMNECYEKNKDNYDWILFYELDEFIHLYNYTNIKIFLQENKFKQCQIIYLNLVIHTDNNMLYYQNNSLFERFPNIVPKDKSPNLQVKMIIKGRIKDLEIQNTANCIQKNTKTTLKTCNGFGEQIQQKGFQTEKVDFKYYYIDHFFSKSTEEFIRKLAKGEVLLTDKNEIYNYKKARIKKYFEYNDFSMDKIEMLETGLKLNLSKLKNKYKNILLKTISIK